MEPGGNVTPAAGIRRAAIAAASGPPMNHLSAIGGVPISISAISSSAASGKSVPPVKVRACAASGWQRKRAMPGEGRSAKAAAAGSPGPRNGA
jgi:hypothetical protein